MDALAYFTENATALTIKRCFLTLMMVGPMAPMADDSPSPWEAMAWLARFAAEVVVVRQLPLISSPPKQESSPKRTLPLRSRWIVA